MRPTVDGIILAAGLSTRMGRPKLLIRVEGVRLIDRVVMSAARSPLNDLTVVVGPDSDDMRGFVNQLDQGRRINVVENPNPEMGMSSSMRIGIASVHPGGAGVMILQADQPWLSAEVIDRLLDTFAADPEKITAPTVFGRRTTPVIFPASMVPELMAVTGDRGGREVLERHRSRIAPVEMGDIYDDSDVDTPEDLKKMGQ